MSHTHILLEKVLTEKSSRLEAGFVYSFKVAKDANKYKISQAIKTHYGEEPVKVQIVNRPGSSKVNPRTRRVTTTQGAKIAYVTMKSALKSLT